MYLNSISPSSTYSNKSHDIIAYLEILQPLLVYLRASGVQGYILSSAIIKNMERELSSNDIDLTLKKLKEGVMYTSGLLFEQGMTIVLSVF